MHTQWSCRMCYVQLHKVFLCVDVCLKVPFSLFLVYCETIILRFKNNLLLTMASFTYGANMFLKDQHNYYTK